MINIEAINAEFIDTVDPGGRSMINVEVIGVEMINTEAIDTVDLGGQIND